MLQSITRFVTRPVEMDQKLGVKFGDSVPLNESSMLTRSKTRFEPLRPNFGLRRWFQRRYHKIDKH